MVKKLFTFISKEVDGVHQAAYLLGFFTIGSQLLALLRDRLLAGTFGAGRELDIYYASFRIPDFIFVSVGSLVSISVLIPFLVEHLKKGKESGRLFVDNIFSFFFLVIIVVAVTAYFVVPYFANYIFPGFAGDDLSKLISLTRILLLSPIFLGFSNLLGTLTQAYKRFFLYALSPILYNIGIIVGIIFLYPIYGLEGLVYGVIFGAILHCFVQIPFIISQGLFPRFRLKYDFASILKVLAVSLPRTLTLSSDHLVMLVFIAFASMMTVGSISVFNFSYNLQSVPIAIIGVSYSLAVFPTLVRLFSAGNIKKFLEEVLMSARHIVFWSMPILILFVVLRAQIVRTILGAGAFNWSDTRLTAAALAIFVGALVFQNLTLLFIRAYYAMGNTKKPLIANMSTALLSIIFAYFGIILFNQSILFRDFLESLLKVGSLDGSVILILPLAYAFGKFLNAIVLWVMFQLDFKNFSRPLVRTFSESLFASLIMGYISYLSLNVFDKVFDLETTVGIFLQGFVSGIIGIVGFVVVLIFLKNQELSQVWGTFRSRMWKKPTIAPDPKVIE